MLTDSGEEPSNIDSEIALSRVTTIKEALALLGLLLLPGFSLRALVVARFDPTVATALVQFTQPLNFLLDFLLDATPVLLYVSGLTALFWYGGRWQRGGRGHALSIVPVFLLALVLSVPIIMIAPFPEILYYCILLAFLPGTFAAGNSLTILKGKSSQKLLRSARTREERQRYVDALQTRLEIRMYVVGAVVVLAISAFFGGMWLAPEVLTVRDIPTTGYALQQQDQDLVVYDPSLNAVVRMPKAEVSHRQFCDTQNVTVSQYLFGGPQGRPPC
jgi:hypothetical protein